MGDISPHSKHSGCGTFWDRPCAPQLMGLGWAGTQKTQCKDRVRDAPGIWALQPKRADVSKSLRPEKLPKMLMLLKQAPPRGSSVSRHPDRVSPTLPSVMGSCSPHTLARQPVSGRKEAVTCGIRPDGRGKAACGGEVRPVQPAPRLPCPTSSARALAQLCALGHMPGTHQKVPFLRSWLLLVGRDPQEGAACLRVARANVTAWAGTTEQAELLLSINPQTSSFISRATHPLTHDITHSTQDSPVEQERAG